MGLYLNGIALVIGAGSGIGRECALGYAAEGARGAILADINYERALDAAQESETIATNPAYKVLAIRINVADSASVEEVVNAAVRVFGRIDYSVNNISGPISAVEGGRDEMIQATLNCLQAVIPVMKEQRVGTYKVRGRYKEAGRGAIVNIGPYTLDSARETVANNAVLELTRKAALDNAACGIRVNAICPGWVIESATPGTVMNENCKFIQGMIPMGRAARPDEIADVVLFVNSPRASYVTGATWLVDGGMGADLKTC